MKMGIILTSSKIVVPILVIMFGFSAALKWCGKANSISEGFGKVLTVLISFFKEETLIPNTFFPYSLDYSFLKNFNVIGDTFFKKFIFYGCCLDNDCEVIRYRIQEPKFESEISEMISMEFRNFLLEVENLNASVFVDTWAYVSGNNLTIYFALNQSGVNWLNQQRANTVSRQALPDLDLDLFD